MITPFLVIGQRNNYRGGGGKIKVKEIDGSPASDNTSVLKFNNGSVTISGDTATVSITAAASSSADSLTRNDGNIDGDSVLTITRTGNVTADYYFYGAVELPNNCIDSLNIKAGNIGITDLSDDCVDTSAIKDGDYGVITFTNGVATYDDNSIGAAAIASGAVGTEEIATDGVNSAEIAANAVGASELGANSVYSVDIVDGEVTGADIFNGTITTADLGTSCVLEANMNWGKQTADSVISILGNKLTAAHIAASAIAESEMNWGKQTADSVYAALPATRRDSTWVNATITSQLDIPSGANPTTDAEGELAVDTDDNFIEFYTSSSRVLGALQCKTYTIIEPDIARTKTDDIILFHVMADAFPHGITLKDIALSGSANFSDTHVIEEWSDRAGTSQSTIESIAVSAAQYQEDDGTLSDASIAADAFININLDDSTDDIASLEITITFWINPGD